MWSNIKRLTGNKQSFCINHLLHNNQYISDPIEISELFADHFSKVSSNSSYNPIFLDHKTQTESIPIEFDTQNSNLPYNHPISHHEVYVTIHKNLKNSAPGLDNIHAAMLKNLHTNALNYLTELFNEIFKSSEFPSKWKTAIVIPILKPKSDQFKPQSYRPISLTSVLGKTFEKIINKRLTWYLESNNIITKYQYGFRKSRSTEHAILDLHSEINMPSPPNHVYIQSSST